MVATGEHPWPSFGRDQRNTGSSPYYTGQVDGRSERSWANPDNFTSSPAISIDNHIYIGSEEGYLNAFEFDVNFRKQWDFSTNGSIYSSPAICSHDNIYFGSDDHNLYAIYNNGTEKWSFETDGKVRSSPVIDDLGNIYFGSFDGNVYAVNSDGEEIWSFATGGEVHSSPAIGGDGTIYIGSRDNYIYAIDPHGEEIWSFETGGNVDSSPAVDEEGNIYVGSEDDSLYAIDPDGNIKWMVSTGGFVHSSPTIGKNEYIYVGSHDGYMYAVNRTEGDVEWIFGTGSTISSSHAVGYDGIIYFGDQEGNFFALYEDGTEKWNVDLGDEIITSPAIGIHGTVYIASNRGTRGFIYAFIGVPSAPQDLSIEVEHRELVLNWEPPLDMGGGEIIGYRIYKGTSPDRIRLTSVVHDTLTYTDDNVTVSRTYYYQVTAINFAGEGEKSEITSANAAELPEYPQGLEAWPGDRRVELTWDSPEYTGGVELIEYRIYRGVERDNLSHIASVDPEETIFKDYNVSNRINYYYRVSAVNIAGEGETTMRIDAMPITGHSVFYCFLIPSLIIASIILLWFYLWYRRWGNPPEVIMKKDEYDHKT